MKIERFEVAGLAQYAYIISSQGEAAVIDAIRDIDGYTAYAAEHDLTIRYVLETHIHADFAAGSTVLAEATGAELALSAYDDGELYRYAMPHRPLRDGDVLTFGAVRLQALHTPGHTPEHLSFLLFDLQRSSTVPAALFSGDFLFVGGLGRPDLLGEQAKLELAGELFRSVHERIQHLPAGLQVYPGHGEGSLCGSGMSERPESTLGYELATTPLLQMDEDAFIREILGSVPAMPSYYPRMKQMNADGAPVLATVPGGRALTVQALQEFIAQDVIVLDVRRPEAFGGAHIPGAINIGADGNISLWAGWMLDPAKRIVLVGDDGDDEASRRALIRVGLDNIEGYLAKGMSAWIEAGLDIERTKQVSTSEVAGREADAKIVDVRSRTEWSGSRIGGASHMGACHMPLGDLRERMSELPRGVPLIVVCGSGYRSSIAASILQKHGFDDARSMEGGMGAWNRQKLPVVRG